jgi:hypothetical protein
MARANGRRIDVVPRHKKSVSIGLDHASISLGAAIFSMSAGDASEAPVIVAPAKIVRDGSVCDCIDRGWFAQ